MTFAVLTGSRIMVDKSASFTFVHCPYCHALYQAVKAQAVPETKDRQISCLSCHRPLAAREGQFVIKYFHLRNASNRRKKGPG
jgi:hypothetical protein